jgi:hypothetical protein
MLRRGTNMGRHLIHFGMIAMAASRHDVVESTKKLNPER